MAPVSHLDAREAARILSMPREGATPHAKICHGYTDRSQSDTTKTPNRVLSVHQCVATRSDMSTFKFDNVSQFINCTIQSGDQT